MSKDSNRSHLPIITDWQAWSQMFLDADIWHPIIKHICQKHDLAEAHTVVAGYPGTCAVFVVDRRVVVKLYPPMLPDDCHKERAVYQALHDRLPQMAGLLAYGVVQDQIEWPYLCLEFRPGQAIRELYARLENDNRNQLAVTLGEMLQTIHDTRLDEIDHFDVEPGIWQEFLRERQRVCLDELREETALPESLLSEVETFLIEMMPTLLQDSIQLHLINADLTEDHLLLLETESFLENSVSETRWQISALIDWADAEIGTAEYEWVALWFSLCNRDRQMFNAVMHTYDPAFQWDHSFSQRMLSYTLLHRFGAGIVGHIWRADGTPAISSLTALQKWLWPTL